MWRHGKLKFITPRTQLPPWEQVILIVFVLLVCPTCSSHFCSSSSWWEKLCIALRARVHYTWIGNLWNSLDNYHYILKKKFLQIFFCFLALAFLSLPLELILLINSQKPAEITGVGQQTGNLKRTPWVFCSPAYYRCYSFPRGTFQVSKKIPYIF